MSSWNKTAKFKALQSKWYGKLTKSGFDDIEHDESNLKKSASHFAVRNSGDYAHPTLIEAKQAYYANCRKFLNEHVFRSKKEKTLFEMHSEGISIRDIEKKLKISRRLVHEKIKELVRIMNK